MKKSFSFYIKLFLSTLSLSAFTFGGGYVMIPLMRRKFVIKYKWLEEEEMMNIAAIAQSSPGAIAVNSSILIGYNLAGIPGSLITILGTVLPPIITISLISFFYTALKDNEIVRSVLWGMQVGVCAVIFDVVISMGSQVIKIKQLMPIIVLGLSFIAAVIFDTNAMIIILISGIVGAFSAIYKKHQEGSQ